MGFILGMVGKPPNELTQVHWSSCIEKVALMRTLCNMFYGSSSGSYVPSVCMTGGKKKLKGKLPSCREPVPIYKEVQTFQD